MRRAAIGVAMIGVAAFLAAYLLLPGVIERSLNRVVPHEPWSVGEAAHDLHASVPVVDLHADPLIWKRDWLERSSRGHTDLPRLVEGGVALQVITAVTKTPTGQNYERNTAESDSLTWLAVAQLWPPRTWTSLRGRAHHQGWILAELDRRAGEAFRIVRTRADLRALLDERALGRTPVGAIFGIEGAHALEGDIANLDALEALGLRVVGLTHFFDNRLGGSLHGVSGEGLTEFGRAVVREAARRRMIVDVAHASPRMVEDVLSLTERPVILSHTGFQGVCDSARNLPDDLMQRIAAHGGLIGVGYWAGAVCDPSPEGVARAIRYGIDLVGVDHVALGSDYDGATTVRFDASELPVLTQAMLDAGLDAAQVRQVLGGNAARFFLAHLP